MSPVLQNVIPIFGLVACGWVFGRTRLFDENGVRGLTNFVFYVAVPLLLMRSISRSEMPAPGDLGILLAYFLGCYFIFAVADLLGRKIFKRSMAERAIMGMAAIYSNVVLLGIPLIHTAYGDEGLLPLLLIISVHPLLLMTMIVLLIEIGRGERGNPLRVIASSLRSLIRNPLIIGLVAGLLLRASGGDLPLTVARFVDLVAGGTTPCALFALGASLAATRIAGNLAESTTTVALKMFALPLVVWALATYVFTVSPLWTTVATVTAALPTAANTFIFARSYDVYVDRATTATVLSTALSAITLTFLWATLGTG